MSKPPAADHPGYRSQQPLIATTTRMAKALKRGKREKQKLKDDAIAKAKGRQIHGFGFDVSAMTHHELNDKVEKEVERIGLEKRIAKARERMAKAATRPRSRPQP